MEIEIGKEYYNKTWKYLLPCLKDYGRECSKVLNDYVFKLAIGIHDTLLEGTESASGRNIYIMLDKKVRPRNFDKALQFFSNQEYYVGQYCPGEDITRTRRHMIIIKVPEKYHKAYDHFLRGEYSQMYAREEVAYLFSHPTRIKDGDVILRTEEAKKEFLITLNEEFKTDLEMKDIEGRELDLPLKRCEEIFNCDEEDKREFFEEKLDRVWI